MPTIPEIPKINPPPKHVIDALDAGPGQTAVGHGQGGDEV